MQKPLRITSNDNPRIKAVLRLRESKDRRETGCFLAEGFREVERAMVAGLRLLEWYACEEQLGFDVGQMMRRLPWSESHENAVGFEVSSNVLRKLAYKDEPEGLMAVFEQPRWSLGELEVKADSLWLVGVGIEKPGNLGAMARTAAAAGAAGLIAADGPIDPFNPNAIRASTGAVFSLPVVSASSDELVAWLTKHQIRLFAARLIAGAKPHTQVDLTGKIAIAIGAEDQGLPTHWAGLAGKTGGSAVIIPMQTDQVDSLNASVAAGVLVFEAMRQREGGGRHEGTKARRHGG